MEFLDINLTKDLGLLLMLFTVPFLKKTILFSDFKILQKNSLNKKTLFMNNIL